MSELIIPTEREDLFLREVTDTEDIAWFLAIRQFTYPARPNEPDAPDYAAYRRLRQARRHDPAGTLTTGIWRRDTFTGYIGLEPVQNRSDVVTVGYRLARQYRGEGYATAALKAISQYAFEKLGIQTIEARTRPHNQDSRNVALRAGYELLSSHTNTLVYAREAPEAPTETG
jgi:RimJ/RimL family protein N-acetyltransferase